MARFYVLGWQGETICRVLTGYWAKDRQLIALCVEIKPIEGFWVGAAPYHYVGGKPIVGQIMRF